MSNTLKSETRYVIERFINSDWRPAADWKPSDNPETNMDQALTARAMLASMRSVGDRHGVRYRLVRVTREILDD